jgi:hypothetical protein
MLCFALLINQVGTLPSASSLRPCILSVTLGMVVPRDPFRWRINLWKFLKRRKL